MRSLAHRGLSLSEIVVGEFLKATALVVLLSFAALVRIPLPFTPVPVTLQNFVVFLGAAFLGARPAVTAVLAYIGLGVAGVPVFSGWGAGALYLLGPTGGYLIGFAAAAWIVAAGCRLNRRKSLSGFVASMIAGVIAVYACGAFWLVLFYGWGMKNIYFLGILPFVAPDVMKAVLAAVAVQRFKKS